MIWGESHLNRHLHLLYAILLLIALGFIDLASAYELQCNYIVEFDKFDCKGAKSKQSSSATFKFNDKHLITSSFKADGEGAILHFHLYYHMGKDGIAITSSQKKSIQILQKHFIPSAFSSYILLASPYPIALPTLLYKRPSSQKDPLTNLLPSHLKGPSSHNSFIFPLSSIPSPSLSPFWAWANSLPTLSEHHLLTTKIQSLVDSLPSPVLSEEASDPSIPFEKSFVYQSGEDFSDDDTTPPSPFLPSLHSKSLHKLSSPTSPRSAYRQPMYPRPILSHRKAVPITHLHTEVPPLHNDPSPALSSQPNQDIEISLSSYKQSLRSLASFPIRIGEKLGHISPHPLVLSSFIGENHLLSLNTPKTTPTAGKEALLPSSISLPLKNALYATSSIKHSGGSLIANTHRSNIITAKDGFIYTYQASWTPSTGIWKSLKNALGMETKRYVCIDFTGTLYCTKKSVALNENFSLKRPLTAPGEVLDTRGENEDEEEEGMKGDEKRFDKSGHKKAEKIRKKIPSNMDIETNKEIRLYEQGELETSKSVTHLFNMHGSWNPIYNSKPDSDLALKKLDEIKLYQPDDSLRQFLYRAFVDFEKNCKGHSVDHWIFIIESFIRSPLFSAIEHYITLYSLYPVKTYTFQEGLPIPRKQSLLSVANDIKSALERSESICIYKEMDPNEASRLSRIQDLIYGSLEKTLHRLSNEFSIPLEDDEASFYPPHITATLVEKQLNTIWQLIIAHHQILQKWVASIQ